MSTREERRKKLLGDTSPRETRGLNLLDANIESRTNTDDIFQSILEKRRVALEEVKKTPVVQEKKPTFEEVGSRFAQASRERAGITTTPIKVKFGLPDKKITDVLFSFSPEEKEEAVRDALSVFITGDQNNAPAGREQKMGVLGFFYGTVLKSDKQRTGERYEKLLQDGVEPDRAFQIARSWEGGAPIPTDLSDAEKSSMRNFTIWENAFIALELADLTLVGKPVNTALKTLTRGAQHQLFQEIGKASNALDARKIILAKYPALAGTEGVEELITLARNVSEKDNWSKVLSDTRTGKKILERIQSTERVKSSTEAQRVFYDNGIPIVRGGEIPAETVMRGGVSVPSQTKDALALRKEIRDVVAGESEQTRLSNLDVFTDEIKAGALPYKSVPEDKVKMYVSEAVEDSKKLLPGDRLAFAKEILQETVEKGKVKQIEVFPKDVVRLSDGTYVYAPKEQLAKGIQPTIRSIRESAQAKVLKAERFQKISSLRKEIANEADIFKTTLANREKKEVARLSREEKLSDAKRVLEEREAKTTKQIEEIDTTAKTKIAETRKKAKEVSSSIKEASDIIAKLQKNIGKTPILIARERDKARLVIKKINNLKRVPTAEKAKRRARVIKEREKEIARLTTEKKKLQSALLKARAKMIEVKSGAFDKDTAIKKIEQEARAQKKTLTSDTKRSIAEAKRVVESAPKHAEKAEKRTGKEKAQARNAEQATSLARFVKESFSITQKEMPDVVKSPIIPVKGEGKEVENRIIKGLQDEVEMIKKSFTEKGLSLADLPETHKAIGNTALMKQAFADLVENPAKVYDDFISGVLPEGTTRAAYALALMKSDFVLGNPTRMDMVARAFYKSNTRIAQELQSIKVFGRMDYLNIVGRFSKQADDLLKARGVDVEIEAKKLLKQFGSELDELPPMSREDIKKSLEEITCKV